MPYVQTTYSYTRCALQRPDAVEMWISKSSIINCSQLVLTLHRTRSVGQASLVIWYSSPFYPAHATQIATPVPLLGSDALLRPYSPHCGVNLCNESSLHVQSPCKHVLRHRPLHRLFLPTSHPCYLNLCSLPSSNNVYLVLRTTFRKCTKPAVSPLGHLRIRSRYRKWHVHHCSPQYIPDTHFLWSGRRASWQFDCR